MRNEEAIQIKPIGVVETNVADDEIARRRREMISDIVIFEEYAAGLEGITEYSHIVVLFWMHRAHPSPELIVHPRGNSALPLTGILAARGRGHPNPIGFAVAELLDKNGSRLTVRRLDAYDRTPIIDIKPYDRYDVYTDIRMPDWFTQRLDPSQSADAKSSD